MAKEKYMATLKWRKESIKRIEFYLHKENDKEVLEWIENVPNKREYLIELIRKDMNGKKTNISEEN